MITNIKILDTGRERYQISADNNVLGRRYDNNADQICVQVPEAEQNSMCVMIITCFGLVVDHILVVDNEPIDITSNLSQHENIRIGFCFLRESDNDYIKNSEIKRFSFSPAQKPGDFVPAPAEEVNNLNKLLLYGYSSSQLDNGVLKFYNVNNQLVHSITIEGVSASTAEKLETERTFTFAGDIVSESKVFDGSSNVSFNILLKNSGVTAGTYTKITVNSKGIITGAEQLTANDIPTLLLSKISDAGTAASKDVGTSAGNVPILDANGKLNTSVLPALAISDTYTVSSEQQMLALTAQPGDVAIRTDENKSYILKDSDPTLLASWQWLRTPDCKVLSVNGKTGAITLTSDDIPEGSNNKYYSEQRATANFNTNIANTTLSSLQDGSSAITTNDYVTIDGGNSHVLPNTYTQVPYIVSSGTQYIDTGYYPNKTSKIVYVYEIVSTSDLYKLFGTRDGDKTNAFMVGKASSSSNVFLSQWGMDNEITSTFASPTNSQTTILLSKDGLAINGTTVGTFSSQTSFACSNPLILFGYNTAGTCSLSEESIKLYNAKIYTDGVMVHNFIPCYRMSDNVVGLYDSIGNEFYTNQGTGVFTYGQNT